MPRAWPPWAKPTTPEPVLTAVSMDNTKAEIVAVANEAGIDVPSGATKAEILELLNG